MVTVSSPPSRCSTTRPSRPASSKCLRIASSAKPRRTWASRAAQLLALVRGEIDDQQPPARARAAAPPRRPRRPGSAHNGAPGGGSPCRRCPRRAAARTCRPGAARRHRARPRRAWRGRGGAFPGCGRCRAPCSAAGPNNSIIRPVPVPMSTRRPIGALAERAARSPPRPRSRRRGASAARPNRRRGRRNSVSAAAARSARTAASRAASAAVQGSSPSSSAQRSTSWNSGSIRGRGPRLRNTQLPSLRRSARPASIRMRTWRETRGWLWPSTCASSPTLSSMARSSIRIRSRVGSARAAKILGAKAIFADIKISLYRSRRRAATRLRLA